jgi:hypothetical protein
MTHLVLALLAAASVQEYLDGTEIGDKSQSLSFQNGGKYLSERDEGKAGKTTSEGTWRVEGNKLAVKVSSCKGPACKGPFGQGFDADVTVTAERAMTVRSATADSPLATGSYYCHHNGCEKRLGVLLQASRMRPAVMKQLLDFLIQKNFPRNVTVVWWGKKLPEKQAASSITWCTREEERGKKGAELVAGDLAELPWVGKLEPQAGEADCLYDVRVVFADSTEPPATATPAGK